MKRLVATEMLLGALVFGDGRDRKEHREPVPFGSTVCLELAVHLSPAMHAGEAAVSAIRSVMLLSCASARPGEKEFPIGWNSRQAGYARYFSFMPSRLAQAMGREMLFRQSSLVSGK